MAYSKRLLFQIVCFERIPENITEYLLWVNSGTLLAAALGVTSIRSAAQNAILQSWGGPDGKPQEYAESYGIHPKGKQS